MGLRAPLVEHLVEHPSRPPSDKVLDKVLEGGTSLASRPPDRRRGPEGARAATVEELAARAIVSQSRGQ